MGRYRKVDPRIWNDEEIRRLNDDSKLQFLFVLTHPHLTSLGAMRASIPGLAAELGWSPERFRKGFEVLTGAGADATRTIGHTLIDHDEQASFVGLPNFLKYNEPENPNVVKSWGPLLDLLPECGAKIRLIERVGHCVAERGTGFVDAWKSVSGTVSQTVSKRLPERSAEPFRNGMPNPEPEPEPEQEPEQKPKQDPPPPAGTESSKAGDADQKEEAEGIIREAGLSAVVQTAAEAIAREFSNDQLRSLTAELQRRSDLGPGALVSHLRNAQPGEPLSKSWPEPPSKKPAPDNLAARYASTWSLLKPTRRIELGRHAGVDLSPYTHKDLANVPPAIQATVVAQLASGWADRPATK